VNYLREMFKEVLIRAIIGHASVAGLVVSSRSGAFVAPDQNNGRARLLLKGHSQEAFNDFAERFHNEPRILDVVRQLAASTIAWRRCHASIVGFMPSPAAAAYPRSGRRPLGAVIHFGI
jgi:hypothetical protein